MKSSPVVAGDKVLIGSYDAHLYALGAKDGKLAWKVQTEGYVHATPAIVDGVAYIAGCDEILRGIRIADGKEVFTLSVGRLHRRLAGDRQRPGLLRHLRQRSARRRPHGKKILWRYKHPERNFPFYSSAAVAGDRIFIGGRDKMLHALDLKTGKSLWTVMTRARIDSSPAVAGGRVYVGSSDGKLYVVDASSGKTTFEFEAGGPLSASPAIASGRLVIGSSDGKVFCLG